MPNPDVDASSPELSILVPVYNEAGNVVELHAELDRVLHDFALGYELIFVDDGSTDGTAGLLATIQDGDPDHVRVAYLKRNCGQTAALSAALDLSRGSILIPMDGDRQNDPADIPRLLAKLDEGSTWSRAGATIARTLYSRARSPLGSLITWSQGFRGSSFMTSAAP